MKINLKKTQGGVLVGTLLTTGIICLYMGSYLALVSNESKMTTRSQNWNTAIPVAEAGVEEAMSQINSSYPNLLANNGWTNDSTGAYLMKTRSLNTEEYYKVGILKPKNANETPVIISQGFARAPLQSTNFISRTVKVTTKIDGNGMPGMVVVVNAVMGGNKLAIDSFNSTNNNFSTNGRYDISKRGDKALVASISTKAGSIDLGNIDVWGKIATGYSGEVLKPGPQSSVGNMAWHSGNNKGIQPGAYTDDVNVTYEMPVAPYTSAILPTAVSGTYNLGGGDYALENLSGNVVISGKVRLLVTKTFNVSSLKITNATGTASLELYVAAPDVDLSGLNVQGRASNFKYFGLPANPAFNWPGNQTMTAGGNGEFTGIINAPGTALTLKGGGNSVQDFSGACLVKSVKMNGHYNFHYDESIGAEMQKGYTASSWDEVPNQTL